jgi:hypothetical protein
MDLHENTGENDLWNGWDTNRPILKGALEALGYTVIDLGIVEDRSVNTDLGILWAQPPTAWTPTKQYSGKDLPKQILF